MPLAAVQVATLAAVQVAPLCAVAGLGGETQTDKQNELFVTEPAEHHSNLDETIDKGQN